MSFEGGLTAMRCLVCFGTGSAALLVRAVSPATQNCFADATGALGSSVVTRRVCSVSEAVKLNKQQWLQV